jgi:ABC-type phosphate/phosphonate transport system substrate-binding protein
VARRPRHFNATFTPVLSWLPSYPPIGTLLETTMQACKEAITMSTLKNAAIPAAIVLALLPVAGCRQQAESPSLSLFAPLETLLGLTPPVRMGVTQIHINPLVAPPWQPLQTQLKRVLGRDVQVLQLKPFQIRAKLDMGQMDFALVSAMDYPEIAAHTDCRIVAAPLSRNMSPQKRGLIVVPRDSEVQALAQLKGKRFAFGPRNDPILHMAAADALIRAGVDIKDLTKEILPPYGFHLNSHEAAKAVLYEGVDAAIVIEEEYASWPEENTKLFETALPRKLFRVLAETEPVPNGPFIAGAKTEPKMLQQVQKFLLTKAADHADLCQALGIGGFVQAGPELYQTTKEMLERVKPQLPDHSLIPVGSTPSATGPAEQ